MEFGNNFKQYMTDDYLKHEVFDVINDFIDFYEGISFSSFGFLSRGVSNDVFDIDSYIYSAIGGTLDSIRLVLEKGRINDAFALTRKYHEAVVMDIFKTFFFKINTTLLKISG
jgi:hypothetical protein